MYSVRHIDSQSKLFDCLHGDLLASFFPQDLLDRCFRPSRASRSGAGAILPMKCSFVSCS